jgi:hypothetical protein
MGGLLFLSVVLNLALSDESRTGSRSDRVTAAMYSCVTILDPVATAPGSVFVGRGLNPGDYLINTVASARYVNAMERENRLNGFRSRLAWNPPR